MNLELVFMGLRVGVTTGGLAMQHDLAPAAVSLLQGDVLTQNSEQHAAYIMVSWNSWLSELIEPAEPEPPPTP